MAGWARSRRPVRPKSDPRGPSTASGSTSMPRPRDRTRKVRPWRSTSWANARIASKSPAASSSDTWWAKPRRWVARSTGPTASIRRTWLSNEAVRTSTRSDARAARASARGGFGRQIMDAFVQRCAMRGLRRIELEVRISNEEAIRFYKRYGFDIAAVLPKFYTDGEDGFKMVKHF